MALQKPTLRDIAELTGLSVSTVSRALKGDSDIAEATRERVRRAAEMLNYRPNIWARGLSTRSSRMFALLTPPLQAGSYYYAHCFQAFERYAHKAGYYVTLCSMDEDGYRLSDYMPLIQGGMFSGVFFLDYNFSDPRAFLVSREVENAGVPYVIVYDDPNLPEEGHNIVRIDFAEQARIAVGHLLELGHRHVAMINPFARGQFFDGYLRAYREKESAIENPERYNMQVGGIPSGGFREMACRIAIALLELDPRPTAVFVPKTLLVGPLQRVLKEQGLRLPKDMAMVATKYVNTYDYLDPAMTSVSADVDEIAQTAVDIMVSNVEHREEYSPHTVTVPASLIIRESCGAQLHVGQADKQG